MKKTSLRLKALVLSLICAVLASLAVTPALAEIIVPPLYIDSSGQQAGSSSGNNSGQQASSPSAGGPGHQTSSPSGNAPGQHGSSPLGNGSGHQASSPSAGGPGLPGEGASGGIFKIVYRINLLYQQRPVGNQGLIIHGVPPCGFVWVFLSGESQTMPSRPEQRVDVS